VLFIFYSNCWSRQHNAIYFTGSKSLYYPTGFITGCTGPSTTVPTDGSYTLLPGVLQAYRIPAADLPAYQAPVPGPLPLLGAASALAWSRRLRGRIAGR
jgi:hypothetical protein